MYCIYLYIPIIYGIIIFLTDFRVPAVLATASGGILWSNKLLNSPLCKLLWKLLRKLSDSRTPDSQRYAVRLALS